jgi:hypothetical protein
MTIAVEPVAISPETAYAKVLELLPYMADTDLDAVVREIQKNMVVVNGDNQTRLQGYVTELKWNPEVKELSFWLGHVSMSKKKIGKVYEGDIEVFFFSYLAADISRWIFNGMYVGVEGKLRLAAKGFNRLPTLQGGHIVPAKQILTRIPCITDKGA